MIEPLGPPDADILLVGDAPEEEEFKSRRPFAGDKLEILTQELNRAGISIIRCRQMNLWSHAIAEECPITYHLDNLMEESKGRKIALVMGANLVELLTNKPVSDISGLRMATDYMACPIIPCFKVTQVTHGGIGEVRMAITALAKYGRKK